MALGSTKPLVKMSTRNISWGQRRPMREATTSPLHVPNVMKIWEPKTPGTLWATPGLLRDCFNYLHNPKSVLCEMNVLTWLQPLLYNRGKCFYETMYRK